MIASHADPARPEAAARASTLAIASNSFGYGSETFVLHLVNRLVPGGTILLSQDSADPSHLNCPALLQVTSFPRNLGRLNRLLNSVLFRFSHHVSPELGLFDERRAAEFLLRYRPAVMLAEFGQNGCLYGRLCQRLDIPLHVHFHGCDLLRYGRSGPFRRHYRKLFGTAAGIIAPSRFLARALQDAGCPAEKIHVVPNGVDTKLFRPSTRTKGRVLAIGRLSEEKGPLLTIRAFQRVAATVPDAHLFVLGDGPLREDCESLLDRLSLRTRVTLLGKQDPAAVARHLSDASVFVQHSVRASFGSEESFGLSVLEAMACAVPTVTTNAGGLPELVVEGQTGFMVDPHDVDAFAAKISLLLRDAELARSMGLAGRRRAEQAYDAEDVIASLRAVLGIRDIDGAIASEHVG